MPRETGGMTQPALVSVVMPVRDGAELLDEQLAALAGQSYSGAWELLVADNGSTDGSLSVAEAWRDRLPRLRVVDATDRPGAAHARNVAAAAASGDLLVFCDADDVADAGWLEAMVAAAADADVVAGRIETHRLNDELARRWRPFLAHGSEPISHGWLPYALSANAAFRAEVFRALGGFREDYPVGEDVEISWRAQLSSYRLRFAPDAVMHYRYRTALLPLLRQYLAYGTIGPRLYRDFQAAGMPPSPVRAAVRPWLRLLGRLPVALLSRGARGDVLRRIAFRLGRVRGSVDLHVAYF